MAVLYTLGFDCDQDEVAAREIAAAFNGFQVDLSEFGLGKIDCDVKCRRAIAGWWTVGVVVNRFRELVVENGLNVADMMLKARAEVYVKAKHMSGYRSALFGCESHDDMCEDDWLITLEKTLSGEIPFYSGLILKKSLTTGRPIEADVVDFSPGYVMYEPEPEG